jgi:hypothetical protein
MRILCPNGHLGFAPIKTASFRIGLECAPELICADSGSCDVGPGPLGADVSSSPVQWQRHDLEHMLLGARRLGVPMIVGSAADTGSNSGVDRFVGIIKDLAREHRLARFRVLSARRGDAGEPRLPLHGQPHGAPRQPARTIPDLNHRSRRVRCVRACQLTVIPERGRNPRTRKPCTPAVFDSSQAGVHGFRACPSGASE